MATLKDANVRGMEELFRALQEVRGNIAVRARRKALRTTAQELTKAAKRAVPQFDLSPSGKATLRRAIYRQDPKARPKKARPMRYRVAVRGGRHERAGVDLGVYTSGKRKGQPRGVRKHSRDAFFWLWFERGTRDRLTKSKGRRGRLQAQDVFQRTFDREQARAIEAGEKAGLAELNKILAKQASKNRVKP